MPEAVAAVLARDPQPGEVYVINDPFTGGTHLPDITLVSRVPCGLACSRAHHADVGGMEPASLPARLDRHLPGRSRAAAGAPRRRAADGHAREHAQPRRAPRRPQRPARGPPAGGAPPRASSSSGAAPDTVTAAMDELYRYSERVVRAAIARLPDGRYEARDALEPAEGELEIRVAVTIAGDEIEIDFTGTSAAARGQPQLPARRHALGLLLRRPLPHRAGSPFVRRRVRARPRDGPAGLARQRVCRPRPSSPATPRRRAASSTSSSPLSARRCRSRPRVRGR